MKLRVLKKGFEAKRCRAGADIGIVCGNEGTEKVQKNGAEMVQKAIGMPFPP